VVDFFSITESRTHVQKRTSTPEGIWVYSKSPLIETVCGRIDQLSLSPPINSNSADQLSKDRNVVNHKEGE